MRESARAVAAFHDYYGMGDGRTLDGLHALYMARLKIDPKSTPTIRRRTLTQWSSDYSWQARCAGMVAQDREAREARQRAEQRDVFESGLGSALDRVRLLKNIGTRQARIVDRLLTKITEEEESLDAKRWAFVNRRYEVMFASLAQTLKDLADETGGRKRTIDLNVMRWEVAQEVAKITGKDADSVLRRMESVG